MSIETTNHRVTEYETFEVRLDGFESLPAEDEDDFVDSEFTCFGHQWCLRVFPGGCFNSDDGYIAVGLESLSDVNIEVQTRFVVETPTSLIAHKAQDDDDSCWIAKNFATRETLIGALVEGALVIEVQMREVEPSASTTIPFTPENPICKIILNKLMDEKSADAVFQVGDERVLIYAHCFILEDGAPTLFDLCTSGSDSTSSVSITNVKPDIFRQLLRYVYGGSIPAEYLKENAKDIIYAADMYQVVNLKLEAEAALVVSTSITINNFVELLLYSHGKNCALLKEAVIDFIVENADDILQKVSLKDVPGALFADLLTAVSRREKERVGSEGSGNDLSTMRVSDLRKKLYEKGMDIDGSREAMIALLDESS